MHNMDPAVGAAHLWQSIVTAYPGVQIVHIIRDSELRLLADHEGRNIRFTIHGSVTFLNSFQSHLMTWEDSPIVPSGDDVEPCSLLRNTHVRRYGRSLAFLARICPTKEGRSYYELSVGDLRRDVRHMLVSGMSERLVTWIARWRTASTIGHALWEWALRKAREVVGIVAVWKAPTKG